MKKLFIVFSLFLFPFVANAASFVVTPSSGSYTVGDNITLHISVDPAGSNIYTAMLNANFSPDIFEVVSFNLNDSMLAMKENGYDLQDNNAGSLIKTGGYSGGINSATVFGTLVLKAKVSGTGTFTINGSSKLLDQNSANQYNGSQTISFTIAKAPVFVPKVETQTTTNTSAKTTTTASKQTNVTSNNSSQSNIQATSSQVAAVVQSGSKNGLTFWIFEILALIVTFALGYFAGMRNWFKF